MTEVIETTRVDEKTGVSCPPWCEQHRLNDDGTVTHLHSFGAVAGIEVTVQRTDRTGDDGKVRPGSERTYVGTMSMTEWEALHRLARKAAAFAGQRQGGAL